MEMSEEKQDRWKPKAGEKYWTLTVSECVTDWNWNGKRGDELDREKFNAGLVFRSREEAGAAIAKMKEQPQEHIEAPAAADAADCSVCEPTPVTAASVLTAAAQHMQDRAQTYDRPEGERSMASTVAAFNSITGAGLTEAQGWLFMAVLKQVRIFQRDGYHADSAEDAAAYIALMAEAKAQESGE
jgi:hypothetical protein